MGNLNDRERFPTPDFDGFLFWGCNVFESYKPNDVLLYVSLWKQLQFHLLVNYRVTLLECKNDNSRARNWNFHISKIILGSKLMNILLSFKSHHKFAFFIFFKLGSIGENFVSIMRIILNQLFSNLKLLLLMAKIN